MGAATAGANNCPLSTLKRYNFADGDALLAAWQAGERPGDVRHCLLEGQRVYGALSLTHNPNPNPNRKLPRPEEWTVRLPTS